ncbi:unnamed protein product [Ixodes persulcatus]
MLNDYPSIENFLCKKEVLYRPENMVFCDNEITGLATLNGQAWLDNRRICLRVLRDMGFGKKPMEEHIKEESLHLVRRLEGTNGSAVLVQGYVAASTSNNVSALVFGSLYDFEDPRRKAMVENLEEFMKALGTGTMIEFFPEWIRAIVMALPFTRVVAIKNVIRNLIELTSVDRVQYRIQEEIDKIVGRDRQPTWEDRHRMPYTVAAIWEMYRCKPTLTLPRS